MGTITRIASITVVISSAVTVLASLPDGVSAGVPAIVPVVPGRILETRQGPTDVTVDGLFQGDGQVAGGSEVALSVEGRHGVVGAAAVMLNVTAVGPEGPGFLTVYPCGSPRPLSSSVNYTAGQVVPNAVLAKLGDGGKVCIWTKATAHVLADVTGFVPTGGGVTPVVPGRILETRQGPTDVTVDGLFQGDGPVAGGSEVALLVEGRHGVVGAAAVMLNVTALGPEGPGFLTVYPCGSPRPLSSSVNYTAGQVVPNAVLAKLGDGGKVCVWTKATTHILADVTAFVPSDNGGGGGGTTTPPTTTTPPPAAGGIGTFLPHVGLDDQRLAVGPDGAFHAMWAEDFGGATVVYGRCSADCEVESSWQLREIFDHSELDNLWLSPGGLGVDSDGRVHALLGGFCAGGSTCVGGDGQFYVTCASDCNGTGTWTVVDFRPVLGTARADGDSNLLMVGADDNVSFFTTGGDYAQCATACDAAGNWSNNWVIDDLDGDPGDDRIAHAERDAEGTTHVIFDDGTLNGDTVFTYAGCADDCLTNASWQSSHVFDQGGDDLGQGGQLSRTTAYQSSMTVDSSGRVYFAGNQGALGTLPDDPYNNLLVVYSCAGNQCFDATSWDLFAFANPGDDADGEYTGLAAHGTSVYLTSVASMDVYLRACASSCAQASGWATIDKIDDSQAINAAVPESATCEGGWHWPKYLELAAGALGVVEIHRAQPLCGTPPNASYGAYVGRVFADF